MTRAPSVTIHVYLTGDALGELEQEALALGQTRSACARTLIREALAARRSRRRMGGEPRARVSPKSAKSHAVESFEEAAE